MCRIHPAMVLRLDAILRAMASVPPEAQQFMLDFAREQQREVEQARWANQAAQARILGEYSERLEYGQARKR